VLQAAKSQLGSNDLKREIESAEKSSSEAILAANQVDKVVSNSISSNSELLSGANFGEAGTIWGVVYSGDKTLESANYEIGPAAQKFGISNAAIYYRQGSFRSVATSVSRSIAENTLLAAQKRRSDAYIVNMTNWCPNVVERTGYFECVNGK
jgi:hypothetical protein